MASDSADNPFGDIISNYINSKSYSDGEFNFAELLNSFSKKNVQDSVGKEGDVTKNYDWKSAYETTMSDFNSYKKRSELAKLNEKKNLTKEIIRGFLDIIDYILYTYKAKNDLGTYTTEDKMILKRMFNFLEQYNVKPMVGIEGRPFDHNFHDAIMVDHSGMFEDDIVTIVISQGYMIGDEVLRHAKVCVSKYQPEYDNIKPTETV